MWYCNETLKDKILGEAASDHGEKIDTMIWITLAITFIVFVITQILLFWFAFKYQEKENRKAYKEEKKAAKKEIREAKRQARKERKKN